MYATKWLPITLPDVVESHGWGVRHDVYSITHTITIAIAQSIGIIDVIMRIVGDNR